MLSVAEKNGDKNQMRTMKKSWIPCLQNGKLCYLHFFEIFRSFVEPIKQDVIKRCHWLLDINATPLFHKLVDF